MQVSTMPKFGLTINVDDKTRNNLIKRDGILAQRELKNLEDRFQNELGEYQDLDIAIKPESYFTPVEGGLSFETADTVQVSGKPTDPETGNKFDTQKATTWVIEEGETYEEIASGVIEIAKAFVQKFNVK